MQKNDFTASLGQLKEVLVNFRTAREWHKFNDPYDLAAALSVETTELLELLLWKDSAKISTLIKSEPLLKKKLQDELADVLAYTLLLSDSLGVDLTKAFFAKLEIIQARYPINKCSTTGDKRWLK